MTRAAVAIAAAAVVALSAARVATQQAQFRARADAVTVAVSVRDGRRAVTGLGAADFAVRDNGVVQTITDVSYERLPIDVTIALDTSLSVTGQQLEQLRRTIRQLLSDMKPDDRLKLTTFNMRVARVVDFTNEIAAIDRALSAVQTGGGSSIWDAAAVAMVSASAAPPDRRQLVVLFTDAADISSNLSPDGLLDVARRTNAALTSVIPDAVVNPTAIRPLVPNFAGRQRRELLDKLGDETGGSVLTAGGNLTNAFQRALEEFRSSYVLHYTPTGVERTGFHTLDVRVTRGRPDVRARRGYFAR
jgi:VWFA-related protein